MRRIARVTVIAAVTLLVGGTGPLAAQEMESGTWAVTMITPEGEVVDLQYEVTSEGDEISIVMVVPGFGELPLNDVSLDDGTLTFSFDFGFVVTCDLDETDDGGFEGECVGDDGASGTLKITPPPDG